MVSGAVWDKTVMGLRRVGVVAAAMCAVLASGGLAQAQGFDGHGAQTRVSPVAELGLRYRSVALLEGDDSERLASRPEVAFRLGARLETPSELWRAQLSVRSGDPGSANFHFAEFGQFANAQGVSLDEAWMATSLTPAPALSFVAGQWAPPWRRGGLVWDDDVRLPGVWVHYDRDGDEGALWANARMNVGVAYLSANQPQSGDEITMLGVELGATWALEGPTLTVDLGYFDLFGARRFGRGLARGDVRVGARPRGFTANTTDTDATAGADAELTRRLVVDGLASDFNMLRARAALRFELAESLPLILDVHGVVNLGASGPGEGHGLGGELGLQLGEAQAAGQGQVRLSGVMLGADAVLDAFNSDMLGTNVLAGRLCAAMVIFQDVSLGFEGQLSVQADDALRGLGDGRGEPLAGGDLTAAQLHVFVQTSY